MYVLMEHRSPEGRKSSVHHSHSTERHPKQMLRGRAVVHSSHQTPLALRLRQQSISAAPVPTVKKAVQGNEKSEYETLDNSGESAQKSQQQQQGQLRRRQVLRPSNGAMLGNNSNRLTITQIGPSPSNFSSVAPSRIAVPSPRIAYRQIHHYPASNNGGGPSVSSGRPLTMASSMVLPSDQSARIGVRMPCSPQLVQRQQQMIRYTSNKVRPVERTVEAETRRRGSDKSEGRADTGANQQKERATQKAPQTTNNNDKAAIAATLLPTPVSLQTVDANGNGQIAEEKKRRRSTPRTTPTTQRRELKLAGESIDLGVVQQRDVLAERRVRTRVPDWDGEDEHWSDEGGEQRTKKFPFRAAAGPLLRSKSQSRNNLASALNNNLQQQQRQQQEKFAMNRSKTATNLLSASGGSGTLGPLARFRARKQSLLRNRAAFSGAQTAVVELFDAEENERRREERERAEQLPMGQFERVQRELRAFAERLHLALGRTRRVRIADLGADQLHAQLAAKQAMMDNCDLRELMQRRPRKKPLQDYYNDDDDAELEAIANAIDPNAPQPSGQMITPARGDFPGTERGPPPALARSVDSILYKWANTQPRSTVAVQLDTNAKAAGTLTYGKLLSRATKIAYTLLTRQVTVNSGGAKEKVHLCLPEDRVALVYPNSEPLAFLTAFYGCLLAGVVPVPIDVPTTKRDAAGIQQFGFLLGSCGVRVALTSENCLKGLPKAGSTPSSGSAGPSLSSASPSSGGGMLSSPSSTFGHSSAFPSSTTGSAGSSSSAGARDSLFAHHSPPLNPNDVADFKGWPRLHWVVTEHLGKPSKDWTLPSLLADDSPAYIESSDREGAIKGVSVSRQAMLAHSRAIGAALGYKEEEAMVCVLDFKREVGLWSAVIAAVLHGMRVHFVPYALMKINPTAWLVQITRNSAQHALVKSRDLHWSLMATREHSQLQLKSLRCVLVADGANPWSLSSCDQFIATFKAQGLWQGAICPCVGSTETGIVAVRRPTRADEQNGGTAAAATTSGRGVLSMLALSHCVVRVDQENSLTSLTLQDTGLVIPGGMAVVVKLNGPPKLCKADEVGEICLHAPSTASSYHGLKGLSQTVFAVSPHGPDDKPIGPLEYVRSGLAGFLGPEGLIFAVGCKQSLLHVSGRVHSADDLIATVLAVEPMKFIYRGRIAVFSVSVLRDERVCIVAEQRPEVSEEDAFNWMVRVLQACDSIHQLGVYCLCLVPPNHLPKTPLGGIHVPETRRRFLDGCLHPSTLLMCPQNCVLNLPKPREPPAEVGPAAMFVGNIVQGVRIAGAQGKELPVQTDECISLADILRYRAQHSPEHVLYSLMNAKGVEVDSLTSAQLLKRAERIAALLLEKGRLSAGDHVALIFPPGLDLVAAVFGCFCASLVPICIRPPSPHNLHTSMLTVRMIVDVSKAVALLSNSSLIKLLRSKEASHRVNTKAWPTILDIEDAPSLSVARNKARRSGEETPAVKPNDICYLDFAVSTTGQLSGIVVTAQGAATQCKSLKVACELYPSRNVTLCLDPCSGLGFALWCLCSVYSGHQSTLIPPLEMEQNAQVWLQTLTQNRTRDTFCSYSVMELCVRELAPLVGQLKDRGINLSSLRNCVVVAEERPRVQLCNTFIKLFAPLGFNSRALSTSFGCRVNPAICMQGASSPDPTTVYVDARALRNDRVTLVEKGAPHSIAMMESGKLLPGMKVVIANPKTLGQCADTHLGEIWVAGGHNASGFFSLFGEETHLQTDHFKARLRTGDTKTVFARTGYLGFLRQTQAITADGELHDAVFVVGALDETLMLRGMRYHPGDIEITVTRAHKRICESAVFTWTHLLVVVAETSAPEAEALDLVPAITGAVLEEHHLIVGVVVVLDPATIPINSRGEKQRMHLRELFLKDQLDPIYVAYNM